MLDIPNRIRMADVKHPPQLGEGRGIARRPQMAQAPGMKVQDKGYIFHGERGK
jgi:hypothetical protein